MEESKIHADLASIRSMMERSSRFISLSGLSGVMAGIYALMGAALAYKIIYIPGAKYSLNLAAKGGNPFLQMELWEEVLFSPTIIQLVVVAFAVLFASIVTGYALTRRKAKKQGQALWGTTSKALLFQMATPLITGGLLILLLLSRGYLGIVSPACLAFYGLALVGASAYTYTDVRYLGICEIALALMAAAFPGYGLMFWAVGFGVLHIVYGTLMHLKYDR
ncbi:hypothetical protein ACFQ3S_01985 [Mucilaginibacter terrae]|uniref:hypothetical protein n=1 Tax=Mucilaginibacter terrae TaxID=1955052 RepID=UPI003638EDD6